jgi:hypothetical protein
MLAKKAALFNVAQPINATVGVGAWHGQIYPPTSNNLSPAMPRNILAPGIPWIAVMPGLATRPN